MRFHAPYLLFLALPWLVGWALFARTQKRALSWLLDHVSERFRSRFTVHSPRTLRWHLRLLALMGLLLIFGAAGPYRPGAAEIEAESARVLLLFDASASMYATDIPAPAEPASEDGPRWNRFAAAKALAYELLLALPDASFAIASFSGSVAVHSPMSADKTFLLEALRTLEIHGQYQRTGSTLSGALDSIFDFQDETRPNLQAVILGDGEQPQPEELDEALEALAAQRVPVHTLAIGTVEGQGRKILDYRDIADGKDDPAVLRTYHTRRVDTELRRISKATGGAFEVLRDGSLDRLRAAIRGHRSPPARIERSGSGTDLGVFSLLGFLLCFLADGLLIGRRPRHEPSRFDISRIGSPRPPGGRLDRGRGVGAATLCLALLFSSSCSNSPRSLALRENEQGIALDALGRREQARLHYRRSMGYGVDAQIPAFNLARSVHQEGDYSRAHDLYQEALEIDPRLPEAFYNDGIALFDWGEAERDPKGCQLERTRELWTRALERLAKAMSLTGASRSTGRRARENHDHLLAELAEIERLIANPPPECLGGGGGSQDESDQSQDENQDDPQDQTQGAGGAGGEGDDQSQGGGGSGDDGDDQGQGGGGFGDEGDNQSQQSQGGGGSGDEGDDQGQGDGGSGDDGDDQGQGGGGSGDQGDDQGQGGGGSGDQGQAGGGSGDEGDDQDQGGGGSGDEGDNQDQGGASGDEGDDQGQGGWGGSGDDQDQGQDQGQGQGGGGAGQGPPAAGSGSGGPSLTPQELEQIRNELARIGLQALESGKYHRRTLPEQFGQDHWANPDHLIWW